MIQPTIINEEETFYDKYVPKPNPNDGFADVYLKTEVAVHVIESSSAYSATCCISLFSFIGNLLAIFH